MSRAARWVIPLLVAAAAAALAWRLLGDRGERDGGDGDSRTARSGSGPGRAAADRVAGEAGRPGVAAAGRQDVPPGRRMGSQTAAFNLEELAAPGRCLFGPAERCEALQPTLAACGRGDGEACHEVATSLRDGTPSDLRAALAFTGRACQQGAARACADEEATRRLVEQVAADDDAFRRAEAACAGDDPLSCYAVIERHRWDDPPPPELLAAQRRLCELGDTGSHGCIDVALRDPDRAQWALEHACSIGSPDGCYLLARHLLGEGVHPAPVSDLDAALRAYDRACALAPAHEACEERRRAREEGGLPD
jgi:TPR repeat protein